MRSIQSSGVFAETFSQVFATILSSLDRRARYLSTEKRDEYHRLWKTLSSRRTAVSQRQLLREAVARPYVTSRTPHSARGNVSPRPIGIDRRERGGGEESARKDVGNAEGGSNTGREKDREAKRRRYGYTWPETGRRRG